MAKAEEKFLEELEVKIAVNSFRPGITNFKTGDRLEAKISDEAFSKYGGFYVVRTPLADYIPDHEAIPRRNGEVVKLGVIPTLAYSGIQRVEFRLDADTLYDLWYLHHGMKLDPVRITTGKDRIPKRLTLDEVQLLIVLCAHFKPEDVAGINATIIHDGTTLRNPLEYLCYGLQVGEIVASISTQYPLGINYARKVDMPEGLFKRASFETLADEIRKLKGLNV